MSTSSDSTDAAASGLDAAASVDGAADAAATAGDAAPETRRRTAVMADVARLAGVSTATVSRALNLPDTVDPVTLSRVRLKKSRRG